VRNSQTIVIAGTRGVPAEYGGFETLAENIVRINSESADPRDIVVYCSSQGNTKKPDRYLGAELRYIRLDANGISSILYDALSLLSAVFRGCDAILLLGVSGACMLPLIRLISRARIITNIDGIEWKRAKWKGIAGWFLRVSECAAVAFSHEVIADNEAIAIYVARTYRRKCKVIAYGGDHAVHGATKAFEGGAIPDRYALALCRIEPENNVAMILDAFSEGLAVPLVFVGNWSNSEFGRELKRKYALHEDMYLLDQIYDQRVLKGIREKAALYVHGHSAGGTNPSLVEMMHFGLPVAAFDCAFNRATTEEKALFFDTASCLKSLVDALGSRASADVAAEMRRIAERRYTWRKIGREYFELLDGL
jgi:glycosyltransferase involved in cell wall biosynthesis